MRLRVDGKIWSIRERVFEYSLQAITLYRFILKLHDDVARIIGKQYLRSATSIGANIEEAHAAESNADFIHKFSIAQKEARESLYWLRLLKRSFEKDVDQLPGMIRETNELIAIITTIIVNTKQNSNKTNN